MRDIGLVLAGGGGRGAYQIGAWQALRELGLDQRIGAVSGTSVGALNGALFAQGNFKAARRVWLTLNSDKVLTIEHQAQEHQVKGSAWFKEFDMGSKLKEGIFSRQGLLEIIHQQADLKRISEAQLPAYAACCQLPTLRPVYFKLNGLTPDKIIQVLLATSAIPVVFDMVAIDGETYVDGGARDNIPVKPLYDAGFRRFIVIHLEPGEHRLAKKFPGAEFIQVIPSRDLGNILTGILDFSHTGARYRMGLGYQDALTSLAPYSTATPWIRQLRRWRDSLGRV
jgi:NTE family protein